VIQCVLGLFLGFAGIALALLRLSLGSHTVVADGASRSLLELALGLFQAWPDR
jgi:hypothetical protein